MSADDRRRHAPGVTLLALLAGTGAGTAADEPLPDAEFLEYLGSWEETDEDWLLFEAAVGDRTRDDREKQSDPAPDGEASPELQDEH